MIKKWLGRNTYNLVTKKPDETEMYLGPWQICMMEFCMMELCCENN